ncbi:MAG: hypothetical protein ACKVPX_12030 [Myxococcaceae bacterium]
MSRRIESVLGRLDLDSEPQAALLAVVHQLAPPPTLRVGPLPSTRLDRSAARPLVAWADRGTSWWRLAPHERAAIAMVCGGLSNGEIAQALNIAGGSEAGEKVVESLCFKLGCASRSELASLGASRGLRTAERGLTRTPQPAALTPQMLVAVRAIAEGKTIQEAAEVVGTTPRATGRFLEEVMELLGVPARRSVYGLAQLSAVAVSLGLARPSLKAGQMSGFDRLTDKEREVARRIALGEPTEEILRAMASPRDGLRRMRQRIFQRFDVDNDVQLAIVARTMDFIPSFKPHALTASAVARLKEGTEEHWVLWATGSGLSSDQKAHVLGVTLTQVGEKTKALRRRLRLRTDVELARLAFQTGIAHDPRRPGPASP